MTSTTIHHPPSTTSYHPWVLIVMGSDSDAGVMSDAAAALDEAGVAYEFVVASAHRSPERTKTVIGVPLASGALQGLDALYAIVQMPPGIPVATVAIGGARNAGVLAAQILAASDPALAARLNEQRVTMAEGVAAKSKKVEKSTRDR